MADPDPAGNCIGALVVCALLLLLTVFLSLGGETLPVIGESQLKEWDDQNNPKADKIRRLLLHEHRFRTRVKLGITLNATLFSVLTVSLWMPLFSFLLPGEKTVLSLIGMALTVCLFDAFASRLPRRLARINPSRVALGILPWFSLAYALTVPFNALCNGVIYPLLLLCGVNGKESAEQITEDDIRELMDAGEETGTIEGTQKDMVNNIFAFDDITAGEIMTPRTDVTAVSIEENIEKAIALCLEDGYSRIPVYEDDIDHIVGILYIKDLLSFVGKPVPKEVTVRSLLRDTYFVPDTKKCDDLFEEMNAKHLQMAIVVDEYGGVAGIVTVEDLLESIVGNMQDEFDNEEEEVTRLDENSFEIDGSLSVGELEELIGISLPEGDYDTVAGFLMDQLGHIPEEDEKATVQYDRILFTIEQMDDRRIEQVLVVITPAEESENELSEE